mmetsp:Transcript_3094/g.4427  ORF Transcript_3094/g.4427 Transcript_3094/m.4427 type:complete len:211 (+) Transcript_3094:158-790(+)
MFCTFGLIVRKHARSFSSRVGDDQLATRTIGYLMSEYGFSNDQSELLVKALKSAGIGGTDAAMIGAVKGMGKNGIDAFAKSIERELEENKSRQSLESVNFQVDIPLERHSFQIEGKAGDSLYDLVEEGTMLSEYLECACAGKMMCSTCHVYVDEEAFKVLGPPSEEEMDMVDLAYEPKDNSRLGCQIVLEPKLNNMLKITIPDQSNNFYN